MAELHIDHPGEVTWWGRHTPLPVLGECPHGDCSHELTAIAAWGPDFDHYELSVCREPAGCNGECRSWLAVRPPNGWLFSQTRWMQVDIAAAAVTT